MGDELGTRDLYELLDVVHELNSGGDDTIVPAAALERISRLVGSDDIACVLGQPASVRTQDVVTGQVTHPMGSPHFDQLSWQHPGCTAYGKRGHPSGSPVALSDVSSWRELLRNPIYIDLYLPAGATDELLCVFDIDRGQKAALSFCRSRSGFSGRDRALVTQLAPHVAQVIRRGCSTVDAESLWSKLTPRERDVARWVCRGATDREIAKALRVSARTVHKHLENTYRKLSLTHRTGLIAALIASTSNLGHSRDDHANIQPASQNRRTREQPANR